MPFNEVQHNDLHFNELDQIYCKLNQTATHQMANVCSKYEIELLKRLISHIENHPHHRDYCVAYYASKLVLNNSCGNASEKLWYTNKMDVFYQQWNGQRSHCLFMFGQPRHYRYEPYAHESSYIAVKASKEGAANLSGEAPATNEDELRRQFPNGIDALVQGQLGQFTQPSVIYDVRSERQLR